MPAEQRQRRQVIVILLVVFYIAGVIIFYSSRPSAPGGKSAGIVKVDPSQIPPGFPDGIPLFYQTKVLQNYYSPGVNGKSQATHQFVSSSSASIVYKMYEDFFLKAGWDVRPEYHPKKVSQQIFYANKESDQATVSVESILTTSDLRSAHQTIVTLNFFTNPNTAP